MTYMEDERLRELAEITILESKRVELLRAARKLPIKLRPIPSPDHPGERHYATTEVSNSGGFVCEREYDPETQVETITCRPHIHPIVPTEDTTCEFCGHVTRAVRPEDREAVLARIKVFGPFCFIPNDEPSDGR